MNRLLRSLLFVLVCTSPLWAEESWPQFRGPGGTGLSKATDLPLNWSETSNVVWKTPIHDVGWSSPVVLGKQIWLTTARKDGKAQYAVCVDRDTGAIVHDIEVFQTSKVPYTTVKDYNSHASPTPVIEPGRVYVHFGSAGTACLDTATGKVLWSRRDLPCDHWRGPASSPILWQNLLFLTFDGYDQQYVTALDKITGKTVWKTDRSIDYGTDNGDLKKAYSTPVVLQVEGRDMLISPAAVGTVAYDPRSGKELWKVYHKGMNAALTPQYGAGKVFLTIGTGSTLVAVRPTGSGDVTNTHVDYTHRKEVPTRPSPLVLGDLLFLVSDNGIASCLEAATGKVVWTRRVTGSYSASPVVAQGRLYLFDHEGKGHVISADREGKVLATNRLDTGCRATPAPVGKALFVRTLTHLYRIEQR